MEKELEKSQQTPVLLTGIDTPSVFLGNKNSEITTFICRVGYKKKLEHMSLKLINKGKITGFGDIPPPTPKFSQKI